jgi:hypothetical protein
MSTATELLRRTIDDLELQVGRAIDEIRAFLAVEKEAEPVAWIPEDELPERYPYNFMFQYSKVDIIRWFPIYGPPRPEPARKPLSDVEIADIYYRGTCFEKGYLSAFAEGFRQAEKHHLIGVSDE